MDGLDPIMQAAERLRRGAHRRDHEAPDYVEALCSEGDDVQALCDFALSILPKGNRPVAIDVVNLPLKCKVYWPCDTYDGIMHGEVTNMNNHTRAYFRSDDSIRVDAYASAADAWLALHWMKLDELIPEEPAPLAS
jgi:hypothetical protein